MIPQHDIVIELSTKIKEFKSDIYILKFNVWKDIITPCWTPIQLETFPDGLPRYNIPIRKIVKAGYFHAFQWTNGEWYIGWKQHYKLYALRWLIQDSPNSNKKDISYMLDKKIPMADRINIFML